ncbi:MAG: class I SAM-dependent DNA methyltransferase [Loktanella sp.]|nr:class I SAM-dependent DNA methyltransferase [Loktanella sp.]
MARFRVHTNWTNTVQKVHEFTIHDLRDASTRDLLRDVFLNPENLKPAKTRQRLTEQAAEKFAGLAQRLRERGHDAQIVAHFVNRLVFCMFAEDVNLLPNKMFQRMLEHCQKSPGDFAAHGKTLFGAMRAGGMVGFERVEWFNGGLFNDDHALPLEKPDLTDLLAAAKLDWSEIDPSILGTLFERGLDPAKRSQLGAHYTDRDKIMQLVGPVVVEPLLAEWDSVKAEIAASFDKAAQAKAKATRTKAENAAAALQSGFLERLAGFRVLDPACGSGNFLYLALLALKDIEHRVNLDSEALGLPRGFPRIGPECVLGIELNPYAAELARVSVWIGEIQWMRRNGFDAARNPILRPLDTVECRDAVLAEGGTRADWPDADAMVGNPPFLGASKILSELGEDYTTALRKAWGDTVPGFADLVCYWFAKAWDMMQAGRLTRAGLVATNSIRGGANRAVLKPVVEGGRIFEAWSDESWTVEGAAVRVSLICFDGVKGGASRLDGAAVGEVYSDLTSSEAGIDLTHARRLTQNVGVSCYGSQEKGSFGINGDTARQLLASPNPHGKPNADVVKLAVNALQITRRRTDSWVIDFGLSTSENDAALYENPFAIVARQVRPERLARRDKGQAKRWWLHARPSPKYPKALEKLTRCIISPAVAKHRIFVWLTPRELADHALLVFARDDDTTFGILHSRFHELWALRMGTSLEDRPRYTPSTTFETFPFPAYTPSTTFETFPFPAGLTPHIPAPDYAADPRAQAIAQAAARLNELRENWLNPPDLVDRVPEVVLGYPDRILPKDDAAAAMLKKRTLTSLYNARPAWLDHAHKALDEAVAEAYGWGDDWRAGLLDDDEILARLFRLNQERSTSQGATK